MYDKKDSLVIDLVGPARIELAISHTPSADHTKLDHGPSANHNMCLFFKDYHGKIRGLMEL